ncbi:MAG: hypothetical protein K8R88_09450 [Armatimonadetes bacterium]|nr:hypothetical protein [Armatimonadota bacterium]
MRFEPKTKDRLRALGWFLLRLACNLAVAVAGVFILVYVGDHYLWVRGE